MWRHWLLVFDGDARENGAGWQVWPKLDRGGATPPGEPDSWGLARGVVGRHSGILAAVPLWMGFGLLATAPITGLLGACAGASLHAAVRLAVWRGLL